MIKVQFANGKVFEAENLDEAIAKCLAGGDDPFNPTIIEHEQETKSE